MSAHERERDLEDTQPLNAGPVSLGSILEAVGSINKLVVQIGSSAPELNGVELLPNQKLELANVIEGDNGDRMALLRDETGHLVAIGMDQDIFSPIYNRR